MSINIRIFIPLAALILAAIACDECQSVQVAVAGVVENVDGNPIPNAQIQLQSGLWSGEAPESDQHTTITDEFGRFSFAERITISACIELIFTISAEGYKSNSLKYSILENDTPRNSAASAFDVQVEITLEKAN